MTTAATATTTTAVAPSSSMHEMIEMLRVRGDRRRKLVLEIRFRTGPVMTFRDVKRIGQSPLFKFVDGRGFVRYVRANANGGIRVYSPVGQPVDVVSFAANGQFSCRLFHDDQRTDQIAPTEHQ